MFFSIPEEVGSAPAELEALLQQHNPWPERELARLTRLAADSLDGPQRLADFRRTVLDVEELVHGCRWAAGNAVFVVRTFPEVCEPRSEEERRLSRIGVPVRVPLLLSGLIAGRDRVIYRDLADRHPAGTTVGAWAVRILADHAVTCSISVLDRLSHLLVLAAGVKAPRGRMYFRDGKLRILRDDLGVPVSDKIMELAQGEDLSFLLEYRDGLAHTVRMNTLALGNAAVDHYLDDQDTLQITKSASWTCQELAGISLMAFELTRLAMDHVGEVCESLMAVRADEA